MLHMLHLQLNVILLNQNRNKKYKNVYIGIRFRKDHGQTQKQARTCTLKYAYTRLDHHQVYGFVW